MQKKISGCHPKKIKNITSSQPRKLIFGIKPYLTQLDEIRKNNTDWGAIKKINKIWAPYELSLCSIKKNKKKPNLK